MATNYYLKLYYEMLDDWKILSLPDGLKWRFIQCLLVAGELNQDGWLLEIRAFAARIRPMAVDALQADLARLASAELVELGIDGDGNERWFLPKFEKRQERSANAKYQADWRQREKEKKEAKKRKDKDKIEDIDIDIDTSKLTSKNHSNITSKLTSKNHTHTYDGHAENQPTQEYNDILTAICNEVKSGSPLTPSTDLQNFAHAIMEAGTADRIPGFLTWWKNNGHYAGLPALKSFIGEWKNYLNGEVLKQPAKKEPTQQHLAGSY